jgi:PAS domain S-box-containing protein
MNPAVATTAFVSGFNPENILEAFLGGTADGFLILDKQLKIISFNQAYANFQFKFHHNQPQEGQLFHDTVPETFFKKLLPYLQPTLAGDVTKFTLPLIDFNHTTAWFDFELHPLKSDIGTIEGIGIGIFDVTEKQLAQQQLQKSEALFKTLVKYSTDVFQLTDDSFNINFVTDGVKNVLGFSAQELLGKSGLSFVHPDDIDAVKEWFYKILAQPAQLFPIEYRKKNKNGDWVWIENNGRNLLHQQDIGAVVMNIRNIQAKKAADAALIQSEQRLSLLLNNTEESFIILNGRLKVTAYNRAAQDKAPYFFKDELRSGTSLLDLIAEDEQQAYIRLMEKVFAGEQVEQTTNFTDAAGNLHVYSHIFRPLRDAIDSEEIFGVFITSTDITEQKKAAQKVKESEVRFKTIIQESFDAVLIKDENNVIIDCSPSIAKLLGYSYTELIGKQCFDFIHADYTLSVQTALAEIMTAPNKEQNVDLLIQHKNGAYVWVEMKGKNMFHNPYVGGLLVVLREISERKNAEQLILLSEQRFKALVQSGSDMIAIVNKDFLLQYCSPNIQSLMGIEPAHHIGKNVFNYVHPRDKAWVSSKFMKLVESGVKQFHLGPYRYRNDSGKFAWIESTITNLLADPSVNGIVVNSRDITERKILTEELAKNNERLLTAQKVAKLGYLEYNLHTKKFYCTDELYGIVGADINQESIDFKTLERSIHPEDVERVKREFLLSLTEKQPLNTEYRQLLPDHKQKVLLVIGEVIRDNKGTGTPIFRLTIQDITENKKAVQEFKSLESRFKSLFENSLDAIVITLIDSTIVSSNPAFRKLLGYTESEAVQLTRWQVFDDSDAATVALMRQREVDGYCKGEIIVKHKSGLKIPAEISSIIVKDDSGKIYTSTIIRDIRDKKKSEEEQKVLTDELMKNNKDLQQFSYITSHNMRAPVANLLSLLSLYNKENLADEFNTVLLQKFEDATLQLNNTLNDLINILVIKSNTNIDKEKLNFSDTFMMVRRSLESLLREADANLVADFTAVDTIEYNKIHLESVFLNLISNAVKYRSPARKLALRVASHAEDNWVVVSFEDNGLGIDLDRYKDRLFGLYQRFHDSKDGKGLGLYMIKSQVEALGGKIEVESKPDKGSIFKVFFKNNINNGQV